jgi:hypothetical protein
MRTTFNASPSIFIRATEFGNRCNEVIMQHSLYPRLMCIVRCRHYVESTPSLHLDTVFRGLQYLSFEVHIFRETKAPENYTANIKIKMHYDEYKFCQKYFNNTIIYSRNKTTELVRQICQLLNFYNCIDFCQKAVP